MPLQPGQQSPPRFLPGQQLRADDLNRIVALLARRIIGGKGVTVRVFGNQIIIERTGTTYRTVNATPAADE